VFITFNDLKTFSFAGMLICFCWNLASCGRLKKVGWSLTLQQLAISGWWVHNITWVCRSM